MDIQQLIQTQPAVNHGIRVRPTERECPRCEAVLVLNDNEQCYECLNCGYIDCGGDDD